MASVYVIQVPSRPKDFSSATRYGELKFVFEDPQFQPSMSPGVATGILEDKLVGFDPDQDYILPAGGDLVGIFMVGHKLRDLFPGRSVKILRWERERDPSGRRVEGSGYYVPSVIRW